MALHHSLVQKELGEETLLDLINLPLLRVAKYEELLKVFLQTSSSMTESEVITAALSAMQRIGGLAYCLFQ